MKLLYLTTWYVREVDTATPGARPHEEIVSHHDFLFYRFFPDEDIYIEAIGPDEGKKLSVWQALCQGVRAQFRAHRFDVVVGVGLRPSLVYLFFRRLLCITKPTCIMYDFKAFGYAPQGKLRHMFLSFLLESVTAVLYTARSMERYYFQTFPRHTEKFRYYQVGSDTRVFLPDARIQKQHMILTFGHDTRDHATLFAAWASVRRAFPDVTLRMVGIKNNDRVLEGVVHQGPVTETELNVLRQQSLCTVFPLPEVSWAAAHLSFLNTLALGVPTIISDVSYMQDYSIDEGAYVRVPVGDGDSLATAIVEMIANQHLREAIGNRARTYVQEHFEEQEMGRKEYEMIRKIVDGKELRC